jgi:hypothetical protein
MQQPVALIGFLPPAKSPRPANVTWTIELHSHPIGILVKAQKKVVGMAL